MKSESKDSFNQTLEKELNDEYEKNKKIANCLNDLEKVIKEENESVCPLQLTLSNKYIVYDLMKIKIQYLNEYMEDDNSIKPFILKAFESLFIKDEDLNYEELDNKITAFKKILGGLNFDPSKIKEQKEYIDNISKKRKEWIRVIETLSLRHKFMAFIFCVVLNFTKNKETIAGFLIDFLKLIYDNFIVNFKLEELKEIEEKKISESLGPLLLGNHANYFRIIIENKNVVIKLYSIEETEKAINEYECQSEDKTPKDKDKALLQEQDLEEEEEEEENSYNSEVNSEPINEIADNQNKNEETQKEIIEKEIPGIQSSEDSQKTNQIDEIRIKESNSNEFKWMIQNLEKKIEKMQNENKAINMKCKEIQNENKEINKKYKEIQNENKKINKKYKEINKKYKEIKNENKEIRNQSKVMENKNKVLENQIMTMSESNKMKSIKNQNKLEKIETKLSIVESDLNLIKTRDALKVFIDFFYRGFNFHEQLSYEERVEKIYKIINSFKSLKANDTNLLKMIKKLLKNSIIKLKLGNCDAHSLDLTKSALFQIFNIIDPKKECKEIVLRLNGIQADSIIMGIIESRENYYYNKVKLEQEEKVWFEKLTDEKFNSIFKKK